MDGILTDGRRAVLKLWVEMWVSTETRLINSVFSRKTGDTPSTTSETEGRAIRWGHIARELGVALPALRSAIEAERRRA